MINIYVSDGQGLRAPLRLISAAVSARNGSERDSLFGRVNIDVNVNDNNDNNNNINNNNTNNNNNNNNNDSNNNDNNNNNNTINNDAN